MKFTALAATALATVAAVKVEADADAAVEVEALHHHHPVVVPPGTPEHETLAYRYDWVYDTGPGYFHCFDAKGVMTSDAYADCLIKINDWIKPRSYNKQLKKYAIW